MLTKELQSKGRARICVPTVRSFIKEAYQCSHYEAQDVLQEIDDVDLIKLEPSCGYSFKAKWLKNLTSRDLSRRGIFQNPGLRKVRLTHEYDLFIVFCQSFGDLLYINAIDGWKDHCKASVCWIDEMWASELPRWRYWLHALNQFDHVFLNFSGTVASMSSAINQSCHWLPTGIDAIRFSPYPNPPLRSIDVYSLGRRWEGIHRALLEVSARREIFYVYDSVRGMANMEPYSNLEHRNLIADLAKRSRYFLAAPAKMTLPEEVNGQMEVGYRYLEGIASGAVLIGQVPDSSAFREMFPWSEVVFPIQPDGSDVIEVLARLSSDSERLATISRQNVVGALLRHDWLYRWKEIFRAAGVKSAPKLLVREKLLKDMADQAMNSALKNKSIS